MNHTDELRKLIKIKNGIVLSKDIDYAGIPRIYLSKLVELGELEKINRGVYVSVDEVEDEMYYMQVKYPKIIYSHETALFLHGLSDRTPFEYSITVPAGYKVVKNLSETMSIYYVKKEMHDKNVVKGTTTFGNGIMLYSIERTICDVLRSRNRIDIQIVTEALKGYVKLKGNDYTLLMSIAKELRVDKVLRQYMEVLL